MPARADLAGSEWAASWHALARRQQWWESSGRKHMHHPLQRGAADRAQRGRRRHLHLGASPAGRMWAGRHGAVTSEQLQLGDFSAQAAGRESMVHSTIKLATHLQRHRCPHGMSTVSRRRSQHTAAKGTVLPHQHCCCGAAEGQPRWAAAMQCNADHQNARSWKP